MSNRTVSEQAVQLVWFKRDLRIEDHQPLCAAVQKGAVLPLFLFEPDFWAQRENSPEHFHFVSQCIRELRASLRTLGGELFVRTGNAVQILQALSEQIEIAKIWSHEETASMWTYQRDRAVAKWAREKNIPWEEIPSNGVVRRLKSRDGWARIWQSRMNSEPFASPTKLSVPGSIEQGRIPLANELFSSESLTDVKGFSHLQKGGEKAGQESLDSFLSSRGQDYRTSMSSPLSAPTACSRISPYIAWGCLSIKSVHRHVRKRKEQLISCKEIDSPQMIKIWSQSLSSFTSRLSWHCHFIQKLEDEPEIEFQNVCRIYDGLREGEFNRERFEAWQAGRTGYPMIDACMRYLQRERWINFRMRAMLMSFAAYHLWLHWREPAIHLARLFLDFEPGIHYPQCQMQSGVTGINTIRIYSPTKQGIDQDPEGHFIRQNVPELANVPTKFIHTPWMMSLDDQARYRCRLGLEYPLPIVDHATAVRHAKERIFEIRKSDAAAEMAQQVYRKHGSRKHRDPLPSHSTRSTKASKPTSEQPTSVPRTRKPKSSKANRSKQQPLLPGLFDGPEAP